MNDYKPKRYAAEYRNDLLAYIDKMRETARRNYGGNDLEQLEQICNKYWAAINNTYNLHYCGTITALDVVEAMGGAFAGFKVAYSDMTIQAERNKREGVNKL